jgi:hypothetical protein
VLFAAKVKLSELGLAVSGLETPVELALSTTGTDKNAPAAETLMNPTSVPEVGAVGPMETARDSGVVPEVGATTSQLFVETVAMVTAVAPVDDCNSKLCGCVATPDWVLNVSCCGLAVSVVFCARAVSKEHTNAEKKITGNNDFSIDFITPSSESEEVLCKGTDAGTANTEQSCCHAC